MLMAKTKSVQKLQKFNLRMGFVHFAQAIVLLLIANLSLKVPVITRFFDNTPEGIRPVAQTLVDVPVALVGPVFLLIAALFHFFIASPLLFAADIDKGLSANLVYFVSNILNIKNLVKYLIN